MCKTFVAMLSISPTSELVCKKCYRKKFPTDKTKDFSNPPAPFSVAPHLHIPRAVDLYFQRIKEEEEQKRIEAEFQERKKRQQAALEEKSALLIEKTWRGAKGRRKGLIIMAARRQLKVQRMSDERKRRAMIYVIKEHFGKAPELPSDTIMEKVVHRFPSWWKSLIIDCVDGDWESALKMIQEQENFTKFKESRGLWKLFKGGVGHSYRASKKFQRLRKLKKMEKKKDKAMLQYRHARSSNSNDGKKEELKLAMRAAKQKFKKAEKRLEEIKERIKEKTDAIEESKGPRRFEKHVAHVRKHGRALKWRRRDLVWKFKRGDEVLKLDEEKNINVDSIDLFGKKLVRIGSILRLGNMEQHGNMYYQIISHNKPLSWSEAISEKVQSRLDADSYRKKVEARKEALKNWDDQHIMLSHEWIMDTPTDEVQTIDEGFVHVMPREIWINRMVYSAKFSVRKNVVVQWGVKRSFRFLYKLGNFLDDSSKKFDDDSSTSIALRARRDKIRNLQQRVSRHSTVWLDEEEAGGISRGKDAGKGFYGKFKKVLSDQVKEGWKKLTKKKEKVVADPFAKWDKSEEKVEIVVNWFTGGDENKEEKLGTLMMDIDAPAGVAREYCRRYLRKELNKRCGENFLLVGRGEGIPLAEEGGKRIGQLAPQKFNNKTKEVEHQLVLCKNPSETLKKKDIPVIKSDARLKEDKEKMDRYLATLLMEEKDKETKDVDIAEEYKAELIKAMINSGIKELKVNNMFNRKGKLMGAAYNAVTMDLDTEVRDSLKRIIDEAMGVEHVELEVDDSEEVQAVELTEEEKFELEAKQAREKELAEREAEARKLEKKQSSLAAAQAEEEEAKKELQMQVELALQKELEQASIMSGSKKGAEEEGGEEEVAESTVQLTSDDDDRWEEAEDAADGAAQ